MRNECPTCLAKVGKYKNTNGEGKKSSEWKKCSEGKDKGKKGRMALMWGIIVYLMTYGNTAISENDEEEVREKYG